MASCKKGRFSSSLYTGTISESFIIIWSYLFFQCHKYSSPNKPIYLMALFFGKFSSGKKANWLIQTLSNTIQPEACWVTREKTSSIFVSTPTIYFSENRGSPTQSTYHE